MEKHIPGRELENVADLFISSNQEGESPVKSQPPLAEPIPTDEEDGIEVEETVRIQKKIAYPSTQGAQEKLRKYLFERIRQNYTICRIELRKTTDVFTQEKKTTREEEIIVFLKDE